MIDIVDRMRFDATRCELQFSKGVAGNIEEAAKEIERLRVQLAAQPWQNIDAILDALEAAGCCKNDYVHAPEDVVANTIRNWLRGEK